MGFACLPPLPRSSSAEATGTRPALANVMHEEEHVRIHPRVSLWSCSEALLLHTLIAGDGQLQGEAGQTEGGGQREGDGEPGEPTEEVACCDSMCTRKDERG
jgi:hypothetical protein